MPRDANGKLIDVGDEILLRCKVVRVYEQEDYGNLDVRTVRLMPPWTEGTPLSLNTVQVEKVHDDGTGGPALHTG